MKTEIIAEIAQGYEGNPTLAELLVKGSIIAGADSVKLQIIFADELCVPDYPYYDLFRSLEMPTDAWSNLVKLAHDSGKKIYFDVYGNQSLSLAKDLEADGVKISTTEFYNEPLVRKAFKDFNAIYISTGGIPVSDLDELLDYCSHPEKLTLMHGFQAEPTELSDNNLFRISKLKDRFKNIKVGFMDHSLGSSDEAFYLPLVALGFGILSIEKHITLDYSLEIEDYISALSIDRFAEFTNSIRLMEAALGSDDLKPTQKEIEYKNRAGKVVVANHDLEPKRILSSKDVSLKRLNSKSESDNYCKKITSLIGRKLLVPIKKNNPFLEENFE